MQTKEYRKAYYQSNKERIRMYYQSKKAHFKSYYENNKDEIKATKRLYSKSNSGKRAYLCNKRYAAKLQRTPKWLIEDDFLKIEAIYRLASAITNITGIKYQVDHILPLQGKEVSGFHMPSNLQIITAEENIRKSNKLT